MKKLSPDGLRSRLRFDYQVCQRMFNSTSMFSGAAYRTTNDLNAQKNPITSLSEAHLARKYRVDFHVRTLIGKGRFSELTTIGFDLESGNYPFDEPPSWVISKPIPYSPHFKSGKGVCTGSLWETANGRMLLGELFVHIAKMLNWDNTTHWSYGNSTIYEGWNPEAAHYYYNLYGREPIVKNLRYPLVSVNLGSQGSLSHDSVDHLQSAGPEAPAQEAAPQVPLFRPRTSGKETDDSRPLFRPHRADDIATSKLFRRRED